MLTRLLCVPPSQTLMACLRQLGLEVGELEETVPELRLRSDGQFSVDNFMLLVEVTTPSLTRCSWLVTSDSTRHRHCRLLEGVLMY